REGVFRRPETHGRVTLITARGRESTMEIQLLGPVELRSERGPVPIGSAKQRALLAFLALNPQRLLTYDALIDGLWGDDPPDATVEALRFHVSRLRRMLR